MVEWMKFNEMDNPFFEQFDEILDVAAQFDVLLSLGDGLRPGSIADASDRGQFQELIVIGELAQRANDRGVQVMIEGPGHLPLNQIEANVLMEKTICRGAPFYVLGPLVTDIAPGYDHIVGAIGGAIAAACGADFLCYVTPSEHLGLPSVEDVRDGVIASKIAAHSADIVKGIKGAINRDVEMSRCRKNLDWEGQIALAINPERARQLRARSPSRDESVCSMCGDFCAIKKMRGKLQ
jgi:phosphomethylpyrimidine synthase